MSYYGDEEGIIITDTEQNKLRDMLLQSLYDYHFANDGSGYTLPKAMLYADKNSKEAIDYLIEYGFAVDSGQGTDNLILSITEKGMEYIKNKS